MDLRERTRKAIENAGDSSVHLDAFAASLREQMIQCGKHSDRSLGLFVLLAFTWLLLRSASLGRIVILGVEVEDTAIAGLVLPVLAAFMFYRFACFWVVANMTDIILDEMVKVRCKPLADEGLTNFLTYPSWFTLDFSLSQISEQPNFLSKSSMMWSGLIFSTMLSLPVVFLLWTSYWEIDQQPLGLAWAWTAALLIILFAIRAVSVFGHMIAANRKSIQTSRPLVAEGTEPKGT